MAFNLGYEDSDEFTIVTWVLTSVTNMPGPACAPAPSASIVCQRWRWQGGCALTSRARDSLGLKVAESVAKM